MSIDNNLLQTFQNLNISMEQSLDFDEPIKIFQFDDMELYQRFKDDALTESDDEDTEEYLPMEEDEETDEEEYQEEDDENEDECYNNYSYNKYDDEEKEDNEILNPENIIEAEEY
jgi:hypothetical protein